MDIDNRIYDDFTMALAIVNEFLVGVQRPKISSVTISGRMTRSLGSCKTHLFAGIVGYSEIKLSKYILDDKFNRVSRVGILIHEILHAYFPFDNHHGNWKKYADMITRNSMFTIQTYATEEDAREFVSAQNRA